MARPRKTAAKAEGSLLKADGVVEIPVEEQPYPLPEGWKWVYLKNGYEVTSSKRIHKSDWRDSGIPFYRTRELVKLSNYGLVDNELFIDEEFYESIKLKFGVPQANDILISGVGTIGVPYIVSDSTKFYFKDGNIIWLKNKNIFLPQFVFYLFKSPFIKKQIHEMSAGTTVDTYTIVNANKTKLPLPPLKVQQRIVDRIESLFAKLDEAKEKAEAVLDGFESRKAAILHKAFTGELTEKWREKNNIQLSSWKQETIASLCHSLKYGTAKKSKKTGSTVVLRMGNLQSGEIDWNNLAYSDDKDDIQKYLLDIHDVLFNRTNSSELVGKTSIYRGEHPAIYAGYLIKMDYKKDRLTGLYLNYVMNSPKSKEYCKSIKSDGVNQSNINAKKIGAFIIPVPSLHEQHEITRILDSLLAKEQQVKEAAESVLEQIELMKKAILARAFRGELTRQVHN